MPRLREYHTMRLSRGGPLRLYAKTGGGPLTLMHHHKIGSGHFIRPITGSHALRALAPVRGIFKGSKSAVNHFAQHAEKVFDEGGAPRQFSRFQGFGGGSLTRKFNRFGGFGGGSIHKNRFL